MNAEDEAKLYRAGLNRRAEHLRTEAVELAVRYRHLVARHDLDPGIAENDVGAIIAAWQRVTGETDT